MTERFRFETMWEEPAVRAPAMSFIVRIWENDGRDGEMRGEIEHVATGEKRFFPDYWSLLNLIEGWRKDLEVAR